MTDSYLKPIINNATHDVPIPTTADVPVAKNIPQLAGKEGKDPVYVPPHQMSGTQEYYTYAYFTPQNQGSFTTFFTQTSIQQTNTSVYAEWQLKGLAGNAITNLYCQFEWSWGTDTAPLNPSFVPPIMWIDRFEFAMNGQIPFQTVYGDLIIRLLIMSSSLERLAMYAAGGALWLNPPNTPGCSPNQATAGTAEFQLDYTRGVTPCLFPYQPYIAAAIAQTQYTDNRGVFCTARFPIKGWFGEQLGLFPTDWIEGGTNILFIRAFSAGRPHYSTARADTNAGTINVEINATGGALGVANSTRFYIIAEMLSLNLVKGGAAQALTNFNEVKVAGKPEKGGVHLLYMDYQRVVSQQIQGQSALTASTVNQQVLLNGFNGRQCAAILAVARPAKTTNNSSYWMLGTYTATSVPPSTFTSGGSSDATLGAVVWNGNRSHLGNEASGLPTVELVDSNNNPIFTYPANQLMTREEQMAMMVDKRCVTNPWRLGLIPKQNCYSPFYYLDIPLIFCDLLKAVAGRYTGSLELPLQSFIRLGTGASANTNITSYDLYAFCWGILHFSIQNGIIRPEPLPARDNKRKVLA